MLNISLITAHLAFGLLAFVVLGFSVLVASILYEEGIRKRPVKLHNFLGTYIWAAFCLFFAAAVTNVQLLGVSTDFSVSAVIGAIAYAALIFVMPIIFAAALTAVIAGTAAFMAVAGALFAWIFSTTSRHATDIWLNIEGEEKIEETLKIWKRKDSRFPDFSLWEYAKISAKTEEKEMQLQ